MEIATKEDFNQLKEEILLALNSSAPTKIILSTKEVLEMTGYSKTVLQDLIKENKLNPWRDSEKPNSKLRFYYKEVISLIPKELRDVYGNP